MDKVANEKLCLEKIPDPEKGITGWIQFAHTINGYTEDPSKAKGQKRSSVRSAQTLTELRCALFHLARADRWQGNVVPVPNLEEDVMNLLKKIRTKVAEGDLS